MSVAIQTLQELNEKYEKAKAENKEALRQKEIFMSQHQDSYDKNTWNDIFEDVKALAPYIHTLTTSPNKIWHNDRPIELMICNDNSIDIIIGGVNSGWNLRAEAPFTPLQLMDGVDELTKEEAKNITFELVCNWTKIVLHQECIIKNALVARTENLNNQTSNILNTISFYSSREEQSISHPITM